MPRTGRTHSRRSVRHRLLAGLALVAYLAAALGLPLPAAARKHTGQPYPCQDNPCGCQSAEQCWRHCCCLTPEQRWAWAREHGVEPPPYAERPAAHAEHSDGDHSCCDHHGTCEHAPEPDPAPQPSGPRWSFALNVWKCQGLNTLWVSAGAVLPPPAAVAWTPGLAPVDRLVHPDDPASDLPSCPPSPPPRQPSA
jgi:hypothetical protein